MNKTEGKWFAYVVGLRGPVPVIYHDGIPASETQKVLVKWDISDRRVNLTLATMQSIYPFPVQQMEKPAGQVENSASP